MNKLEKFCLPQMGKSFINIGFVIFTAAFLSDIFTIFKNFFLKWKFNSGLFFKSILIYLCIVGVYVALREHFVKKPKAEFKHMIDVFQSQGIIDLVINDFDTSITYFWDKVLAGQYFLFVKNRNFIVNYKDIISISTYVTTSEYYDRESREKNFKDTQWLDIMCVGMDSCRLDIPLGSKNVYQEFCEFVRLKNPNVSIKPF